MRSTFQRIRAGSPAPVFWPHNGGRMSHKEKKKNLPLYFGTVKKGEQKNAVFTSRLIDGKITTESRPRAKHRIHSSCIGSNHTWYSALTKKPWGCSVYIVIPLQEKPENCTYYAYERSHSCKNNHNPTLNVGFAERPYKGHYSSST